MDEFEKNLGILWDYFGYLVAFLIKKCYNRYKLITSGRKENMDFKRLVKELRTKLIITQEELANLLGVSFASINRWETGRFEPTMKIKRKLAPLFKEHGIEVE